MKITALSEYKGDTFAVELDGERKLFVNAAVVSDHGLYSGMELSAEGLSAIKDADILRKAKKRALYLLGARAYCSGELRQKLAKTYNDEIAEAAVEYVSELGYIDDREYAGKLAEYLIRSKKRGVRRARMEMLRKGLDRELCDEALSEYSEDDIDEELTALIGKKYINKLADRDDRRRTIAALVRRGYDFGAVKRCIAAFPADLDDEFYEED